MSQPEPSLDTVTTIRADGSRRFIHPAHVGGRFTRWRSIAGLLLMALYAGLPWITVNGNPAVFFDLAARRFHLFGLTFVAQDLWLAFFLVTGLGFGLFYVTALAGRVWCGWACPQTVFLDIIRRFERWIEGDAPARRRLDAAPWTAAKLRQRALKQAVFGVFALLLAHGFMAYFVSLPRLYAMMGRSPLENLGIFAAVFLLAAALWFDFAWFREQFCIVLCPYGRLQSALIDSDSVVIGYDTNRGEPRGKKGTPGAGDCIDCGRCVRVCPTGIDIRQGLQLECIACANCIDACDEVMARLGRQPGLIRYDSLNGLGGMRRRILRPRILLYTGLLAVGLLVTLGALSTFRGATVTLTRMVGAPYFVDGGAVRNQYLLRLLSKRNEPTELRVSLVDPPPGVALGGGDGRVAMEPFGEELRAVVVTAPKQGFAGPFKIKVRVESADGRFRAERTASFLGPMH